MPRKKPETADKAHSTAATEPQPETAEQPPKHAGGRPSDYRPEYIDQARKLAEAGFTDQQMADFFECSTSSFYRWCAAHPEFREAIKLGKDAPDERIERSLYHRANGFEWVEEQAFKVKDVRYVGGNREETERVEIVEVRRMVPPDATSAIFWLKNRRGWKDKSEVDHGLSGEFAAFLGLIDGNSSSIC